MYELMTLIRTCDERIRRGLSAGEFAFTYWPATGQEAIAAALGTVLANDDQLVTTYRGLHDQVAKGVPLGPLVAEILTRATGVNGGKGGAMHISHPRQDWSCRRGSSVRAFPSRSASAWPRWCGRPAR